VYATDQNLQYETPDDREIGRFGPAVVQVKPYIPIGYLDCVDEGAGALKPLAYRTRPGGALSDLGPRGQSNPTEFPILCKTWARDYGIGVWQRNMAAVMQVTTNAAYTAPVLS